MSSATNAGPFLFLGALFFAKHTLRTLSTRRALCKKPPSQKQKCLRLMMWADKKFSASEGWC